MIYSDIRLFLLVPVVLLLASVPSATAQTVADAPRDVWAPAGVAIASTAIPVGLGVLLVIDSDYGIPRSAANLVALGTIIGPSVGSMMLGDTRRAGVGMLIRTGANAALVGSFLLGVWASWDGSDNAAVPLTNALMVLSASVLAYGIAYNFYTLPASASRVSAGLAWDATSGALMPGIRVRF